jgi:arylsulfatase A-like enzyme
MYTTPNIDRIAKEGSLFTDYYGEQSCTAGRASFITGQNAFRVGLTKVGMPGAKQGISAEDPTIAELLKPHGYMSGQFGKNLIGDRMSICPRFTASTSMLGAGKAAREGMHLHSCLSKIWLVSR